MSPVGAINNEFSFLQHVLPVPEVPAHSDVDGLNLNITVPLTSKGQINTAAKLPVYVFIHGGSFAVGSSWYPQYDPAALVKLSAELGKPIIGVTIKQAFHFGIAISSSTNLCSAIDLASRAF